MCVHAFLQNDNRYSTAVLLRTWIVSSSLVQLSLHDSSDTNVSEVAACLCQIYQLFDSSYSGITLRIDSFCLIRLWK